MLKAKLLFLKAVTRTKFFAILLLFSLLIGLLSGLLYSSTYEVSRSYITYLFHDNVDAVYYVSLPDSQGIRERTCDLQNIDSVRKYLDNATRRIESLPQVKSSGWILGCYFVGYGGLDLLEVGYSDTRSMENIFNISTDILFLLNDINDIDNTTRDLLEHYSLSYHAINITNTTYASYLSAPKEVYLIINLDTVNTDTILKLLISIAQDERVYSFDIGSLLILVDFDYDKVLPASETDVNKMIYGTISNLQDAETTISSILLDNGIGIVKNITDSKTAEKEVEVYTVANIPLKGMNSVYKVLNNISLYLMPLFIMIMIPILYILYVSTKEYSSLFNTTIRRSMEIKGIWSSQYYTFFMIVALTVSMFLALIIGVYYHDIRAGVFSSIITGSVVALGLVRKEDRAYLSPRTTIIFYMLFLLYVVLFVYKRDLLYLLGISPILSLIVPILYWLRPFYTIPILLASLGLLDKILLILDTRDSSWIAGLGEKLFLRIVQSKNYIVIAMVFTLSIASLNAVFPSRLLDYKIYRYAVTQNLVPMDALLYITEDFVAKIEYVYSILTAILAVALLLSLIPSYRQVKDFTKIHGLSTTFPSIKSILMFLIVLAVVFVFTFGSLSLFLKSYFYSFIWWE